MANLTPEAKLEAARVELAEKLDELRARAKHVRKLASPATYWQLPAVRFGLGLAAGYLLGRRSAPATEQSGPPGPEGILHAVVKATLTAVAASIVRRTLAADRAEITVGVTEQPAD